MIEGFGLNVVYAIAKDIWRLVRGRNKSLTPEQIIEKRQKWKPLFEEEIWKNHKENLRKDVIIRDVKRFDKYPDIDDKSKGISPWFRAGLVGVYHKGALIALRWSELVQDDGNDEWRGVDCHSEEKGDLKVILIGKITFESIEAVDWDGDEMYYFPHIYCHFDKKRKEPYEDLVYCVERCDPGGRPFYEEIVPYDKVVDANKKLGITSYC